MKNLKKIVSLVMVVAIVASVGATAFASNRFKTDDVTDWQYGMLNDLSSGKRTIGGQKEALVVSPASQQSTRTVVVAQPTEEVVLDGTVVRTVVETEEVVVATPVRTVTTKATTSANPYVNEWQEAILNDLATGTRKVGQNAPITVYKDANTAYKPSSTTYDYIAWR